MHLSSEPDNNWALAVTETLPFDDVLHSIDVNALGRFVKLAMVTFGTHTAGLGFVNIHFEETCGKTQRTVSIKNAER